MESARGMVTKKKKMPPRGNTLDPVHPATIGPEAVSSPHRRHGNVTAEWRIRSGGLLRVPQTIADERGPGRAEARSRWPRFVWMVGARKGKEPLEVHRWSVIWRIRPQAVCPRLNREIGDMPPRTGRGAYRALRRGERANAGGQRKTARGCVNAGTAPPRAPSVVVRALALSAGGLEAEPR